LLLAQNRAGVGNDLGLGKPAETRAGSAHDDRMTRYFSWDARQTRISRRYLTDG
jgi:hypothetical protein